VKDVDKFGPLESTKDLEYVLNVRVHIGMHQEATHR
jgi:hypothetical protein